MDGVRLVSRAFKATSRSADLPSGATQGRSGGTPSIENNVPVYGYGDHAMILQGFRCDQNLWRFVARALEKDFMAVCSTMSAPAAPTRRPIPGPGSRTSPATPTTRSRSARSSDSRIPSS